MKNLTKKVATLLVAGIIGSTSVQADVLDTVVLGVSKMVMEKTAHDTLETDNEQIASNARGTVAIMKFQRFFGFGPLAEYDRIQEAKAKAGNVDTED